ncbi:zinc-ribbon domain-containing protein [Pseudobacteroides cellulosolvens]|uniref:Zinc-ribbon domain-containing protein n=1 Tax=Pseudobacteroides cellulosolvens ATCC 35603 = DSM 2933 TaxID=398512 RepID=A0A0L6JJB0_9FIRM|nr:hypothetical protein Bccel_1028 [Pseudobacteroides cellulosolvens ATCC 35603 = DSM 2933]
MFQILYQIFFRKTNSQEYVDHSKKSCRTCGKKIKAEFSFCPYCGSKQDKQTHNDKEK